MLRPYATPMAQGARMITADDVLAVMDRLARAGVPAWLDGGWGVDALLERQTREHTDLDLVVELAQADIASEALAELGYVATTDERPTRLELTAADGRQIDLHTVVFDDEGGGIQHLQNGRSYRYPQQGFTATGRVAGRPIPCLTPEVQLECHTGYEPTDVDRQDVSLLVERFGLRKPSGY